MPAELCVNRTKNDLDRALRQLLLQKPLEQIRVRELTALCGIRRQSFYYHFPDVQSLFDWSIQQEAMRTLARQETCLTWQQALTVLLEHTAKDRCYYQALLKNRGRAGLRKLLEGTLGSLLSRTLDYYQRRCGVMRNPPRDQELLSCWETMLLTLLESWIQGDLPQPPQTLVSLLEGLVQQGAVGAAWQNLALLS